MHYQDYALKTLDELGIHQFFKGSEYILCGIGYLNTLDKYATPDVDTIYNYIADEYVLTPMSIENSIRNVISRIWLSKENPALMSAIFGPYNLKKRPCNMEFIIMLYNYVHLHLKTSDTIRKLDLIWEESKKEYTAKNTI